MQGKLGSSIWNERLKLVFHSVLQLQGAKVFLQGKCTSWTLEKAPELIPARDSSKTKKDLLFLFFFCLCFCGFFFFFKYFEGNLFPT